MCDVRRVALSRFKSPQRPRVVQGVSAREDDITDVVPVQMRFNETMMSSSACPISVNAEIVTSGNFA